MSRIVQPSKRKIKNKTKIDKAIRNGLWAAAWTTSSTLISVAYLANAVIDDRPASKIALAIFAVVWGAISIAEGYSLKIYVSIFRDFEFGSRAQHELKFYEAEDNYTRDVAKIGVLSVSR